MHNSTGGRKRFAENLRAARKGAEISQEKLAAAIKMSRSYIFKLERGTENPTLDSMIAIAKALYTTVARLLEGVA